MKADIRLSDKEFELIWGNLLVTLEKSTDRKMIATLLVGTLGKAERIMMAKRLMIGILTVSDISASEIAVALGLSRSTVYTHQRSLDINPLYKSALKVFMHKNLGVKEVKFKEIDYVARLISKMN